MALSSLEFLVETVAVEQIICPPLDLPTEQFCALWRICGLKDFVASGGLRLSGFHALR